MTEKTKAVITRLVYGEGRGPPKHGNADFDMLLELIDEEIENAAAAMNDRDRRLLSTGQFILKEKRK